MKALALASIVGLVPLGAALAGEHAANEWEIRKMILGHTIKCGGADCRYGADGSYSYNGGTPGQYTISPGSICVKFLDGSNRCDHVVVDDGGAYTIINSYGQRLSFVRPDLPGQGTNPGLNPTLEPLNLQQPPLTRPSLNQPLARPSLVEPSAAGSAASPGNPRVGAPAASGILAPSPSGLGIGQPQPNALGLPAGVVSPPAGAGVVAPQIGSEGVPVYGGGLSPSGAGLITTPAGLGANAIAPKGYGGLPQAGAVPRQTGVGPGANPGLPAAASGAATAAPATIYNPYMQKTPGDSGASGGLTGGDERSGQ